MSLLVACLSGAVGGIAALLVVRAIERWRHPMRVYRWEPSIEAKPLVLEEDADGFIRRAQPPAASGEAPQ